MKSADSWHGGWYQGARHLHSANFGERPDATDISLIVVHAISLPPGRYGTGCVQQLFTNSLNWDAHPYFQQIRGLQVSSHFYIERSGLLWQFVDCDARAWHAGQSRFQGRSNCNDFSIGIELEGLDGETFEPGQYASLAKTCAAIAKVYPISAVAGHEHIAPGRKHDPGAGFVWSRLQRALSWPAARFPFLGSGAVQEDTLPPDSTQKQNCR